MERESTGRDGMDGKRDVDTKRGKECSEVLAGI